MLPARPPALRAPQTGSGGRPPGSRARQCSLTGASGVCAGTRLLRGPFGGPGQPSRRFTSAQLMVLNQAAM